MQTTHTPLGLHWPIADQPVDARLKWLRHVNAAESARLAREALEEELMMMSRPVSIKRAYALFGLLLGTLPPAAIFYRLFGKILANESDLFWWFWLILTMNVVCALAGRFFASRLSGMADTIVRESWPKMLLLSPFVGLLWGVCTGALGGLIFFIIGAFFGAFCAMMVGIVAFAVFMPLHCRLAHDGMIEAAHLWPLACGVTMTITALILGL
jgi:hypothetical protein